MTNIAAALLSAQYCLNRIEAADPGMQNVTAAYNDLVRSLEACPSINREELTSCLQIITDDPESIKSTTAVRKISKCVRYSGEESEIEARNLLENVKQFRDGYYFIAQSEIAIMSKKKKTIIICEDMREFRQKFVDNHKDEYNVIALDKLEYIQPVLNYCATNRCFPDLLILDLYWPREGSDQNKIKGRGLVNNAIENHKKEISRLRNVVFEWLEPCAIAELVRVRKSYQSTKLPVLMYTRAGNFTLDDPDVEVIYSNDADFMPKYRPAHVERQRIRYCVEMRMPWWKKPPSDINWRITFLTIGLGASLILNIIMALIKS